MAGGESPASRWRWRIAVVAVAIAAAGVALVVGFRDGGSDEPSGSGEVSEGDFAPERSVEPRRRPATELTVSVSGDTLIHSPVYGRALALGGGEEYDFAPLFAELRPYVAKPDLGLCHLETVMGPGAPQSYPLFNSPPSLARAIERTGWDACSTASNHSLDQGQEGVASTIEALDAAGVEHTGTFTSARAQNRPMIEKVKGVRVALLSYTTDTNGIPPPAPYSVNLADSAEPILAGARRARRAGADAVIVNIHWGADAAPEYVAEVAGRQEDLVRPLVKSPDVTAVVGQGPHVVQPIRRVEGEIVVFSEGNLISDQDAACCAEASQDGLIALLDLVSRGDRVRLRRVRYVPVWVSRPGYAVLPAGSALRAGAADPALLRASYRRTVAVAGRDPGIEPVPRTVP
jgi:poly-gamma-glutamate capsule biosynthesis protein CapA/YwtB (metallophosphatase superfamily)